MQKWEWETYLNRLTKQKKVRYYYTLLYYITLTKVLTKAAFRQVQALMDHYLIFPKPCGGLTPCLQGKFYRSPPGSFRNPREDFPVGSIKLWPCYHANDATAGSSTHYFLWRRRVLRNHYPVKDWFPSDTMHSGKKIEEKRSWFDIN